MRIDVLLHRLCLTRSRSEAQAACQTGAVTLDQRLARPSDLVAEGARVCIRYPSRLLELELVALPGKGTSKASAREMYAILRDEKREPE